jgi:hypothetical protein
MEQVNDNQHGQLTANTRQPTPGSQEPATPTDSDTRWSSFSIDSAVDNSYPTTNKKNYRRQPTNRTKNRIELRQFANFDGYSRNS